MGSLGCDIRIMLINCKRGAIKNFSLHDMVINSPSPIQDLVLHSPLGLGVFLWVLVANPTSLSSNKSNNNNNNIKEGSNTGSSITSQS